MYSAPTMDSLPVPSSPETITGALLWLIRAISS